MGSEVVPCVFWGDVETMISYHFFEVILGTLYIMILLWELDYLGRCFSEDFVVKIPVYSLIYFV